YRFSLKGSNLDCLSGKHFLVNGNEKPMVNIAAEYGVTLKWLRELNPAMRSALFCNGPVLIGEIAPLKSLDMTSILSMQ
ncbi:MAG TPA: hypothetical protein PLA90_00280, partial [Candidatus Sumerlaeota bacterium]|nr:hypothetical protein [Candidatus Sumerlaeota bacterium]